MLLDLHEDMISKTKSETKGSIEYLRVYFKFASLSPGGREIARTGVLEAALVDGDAVMLVSSATSNRWKKVEKDILAAVDSFAAFPAPKGTATDRSRTF
ncbi:hypothetical protein T484DRAFT_1826342 [Baffinella frigidus]|nr:hypothetical protein T484DRAFT_1826342 [Cryptophyta sp. CCMP2293]